jgi:hypothetical protein
MTSSAIASPERTSIVGLGVESPGTKNAIERHTTTIERGCVHALDAQTIIVAATYTAVRRTARRTAERKGAVTAEVRPSLPRDVGRRAQADV